MERKIKKQVRGYRTQDGAGVKLVRVLSGATVEDFDPILMLDSFDSTNPADYAAGFPLHPHRGIETISYVYRGQMTHRDSLCHEDTIGDGEVQWMTAGSGIMHEEMLPASERMLGVQLWLNLPAKNKMTHPAYHSVKNNEIEEFELDDKAGKIRLLAGEYEGHKGFMSSYLPLDYYDLHLNPGSTFVLNTEPDSSVMLFTLLGDAIIAGERVVEKTAVNLTAGDFVKIEATDEKAQVLIMSSRFLGEPVAWGGPIVMNTRQELVQAFAELRAGTFLREGIEY